MPPSIVLIGCKPEQVIVYVSEVFEPQLYAMFSGFVVIDVKCSCFNLTNSRSVDVQLPGQQKECLPQNVDIDLDRTTVS